MEVGSLLPINWCQYSQPLLPPLCMALYSEGMTFHKPPGRSVSIIQVVLQVWDGPEAVSANHWYILAVFDHLPGRYRTSQTQGCHQLSSLDNLYHR